MIMARLAEQTGVDRSGRRHTRTNRKRTLAVRGTVIIETGGKTPTDQSSRRQLLIRTVTLYFVIFYTSIYFIFSFIFTISIFSGFFRVVCVLWRLIVRNVTFLIDTYSVLVLFYPRSSAETATEREE